MLPKMAVRASMEIVPALQTPPPSPWPPVFPAPPWARLWTIVLFTRLAVVPLAK